MEDDTMIGEEDDDGVIMDDQGNKFESSIEKAEKTSNEIHQEIAAEKKARSVIGMLRTKVHQGKHRKKSSHVSLINILNLCTPPISWLRKLESLCQTPPKNKNKKQ